MIERSRWSGEEAVGGTTAVRAAPDGEEASSLIRALFLLRRRYRLLALVVGGFAVAGTAVALGLPPVYRAEATLEIRPERPLVAPETADGAAGGAFQLWENYFRTQESILRGPGVMEHVLASLPAEIARPYREASDPARALAARIDVDLVPSTFLIRVAAEQADPRHAAAIVNAIASIYLEDANRRLREVREGVLEALSHETLPAIRQKVDEADRNLRSFQSETGFADFEEQYASLIEARRKMTGRLSDVRLRSAALRSERDALAEVSSDDPSALQASALQRVKGFEALLAQRSTLDAELSREAQVLKDKHPRVVSLKEQIRRADERLRDAVRSAFHSLDRELAGVQREDRALGVEKQRIERDMSDARLRLTNHRKLEAELSASRELYTSYLRKHGEVKATSGAGLGSVRVVDSARVPSAPHRRSRVFITLGLVLGLLFGLAAVAAAEQVDDRLRGPREAEVFLGLEVLGVIPERRSAAVPGRPLLLQDDPVSLDLESFRSLRAEVMTRMDRWPGTRIIAVLGPQTGEGKSTVAIHLARVLALEGRRVLLFDAELRRPRLKALLGDERGPGLEELLRGEVPLPDAVQRSVLPGVDLLGAEGELARPAEEATSARFRAALREAGALYDGVVVDAGPVNVFTEAALVARGADATLLVVREGYTRRAEARAAAKRLRGLGVRLLGAVVNASRAAGGAVGTKGREVPLADPAKISLEQDLVAWV